MSANWCFDCDCFVASVSVVDAAPDGIDAGDGCECEDVVVPLVCVGAPFAGGATTPFGSAMMSGRSGRRGDGDKTMRACANDSTRAGSEGAAEASGGMDDAVETVGPECRDRSGCLPAIA